MCFSFYLLPYKVPEVWLFTNETVTIYCLSGDRYLIKERSRYFPALDVLSLIAQCFEIANERNTSVAIRQLRQKLNQA